MIKRILVALDPDRDTKVATRYATGLARIHKAEVSGLAVVDTQGISRDVGPGGAVGATYYAEKLRAQITAESHHAAVGLLESFEEDLAAADVRHTEHVCEGVPARRIVEDMKYHDLLVIGRIPHFYYPDPEKKTHTLAQIVKNVVAPTLVVPDTYRHIQKALIAYDGSTPSALTLQRFAQLQPFGIDIDIDLVHVRGRSGNRAQGESDLLLMLASKYLRAHGFVRIEESSLRDDAPASAVMEYAQSSGADLIVAGAHSVSAMRRLAFGSTTHRLLEECVLPFFLYH